MVSVKSILVNSNETMKKLIEDDKFEGYLELFEECSETGFLEMERYYSGCEMNISKENKESRLSENEKEEMKKIIKDEVLLEEMMTNRITIFKYIPPQHCIAIYQEVKIVPLFEGGGCEFLITPALPDGLLFDKKSGIIYGRVDKPFRMCVYEVICKNIKNEKRFKISLQFEEIQFMAYSKSEEIIISNNGKLITQTKDWHYSHCYLNIKMDVGIFGFKYKYHQNNSINDNWIVFGLSTDCKFTGDRLFTQPTTCNFFNL